jgi:hypothetical protein
MAALNAWYGQTRNLIVVNIVLMPHTAYCLPRIFGLVRLRAGFVFLTKTLRIRQNSAGEVGLLPIHEPLSMDSP